MNKFILCTFFFSSVLFISCSKQIEGKVLDNFGKPIEDVEVSISNTQYKTTSNKSGEYAIDYAAGEVIINFQKEGYIDKNDLLYITEKQTYPLKEKTLVKLPDQLGIYITSPEYPDYIQLKAQDNIRSKILQEPSDEYL